MCFGHGASGDRCQQPIPWLVKRLVAERMGSSASRSMVRCTVGAGPVMAGEDAFWPEWERQGTVGDMTADWMAALEFRPVAARCRCGSRSATGVYRWARFMARRLWPPMTASRLRCLGSWASPDLTISGR